MNRRNELLIRAYLVMFAFVSLALVIMVRVAKVNVVEGDKWRKEGGKTVKWMPVNADRGNIYSCDGDLLATSLMFFEIRMDFKVPSDELFDNGVDTLALMLSRHVMKDKSRSEIKSMLLRKRADAKQGKPGSSDVFLAKGLTYEDRELVRTFPIFRKGQFGGGLIIKKSTKRVKPFKSLASRAIGEDRENASKIGLEGAFDKQLSGEKVQRLMRKVGHGVWVPLYDPSEFEVKKGGDIVTTLDMQIQDVVHRELLAATVKSQAKAATAIVMDVQTGAIKAITNFSRTQSGNYAEDFNHALATSTEPGSTFKLATALAMLDDGKASLTTNVDLHGGKKKFYDLWMRDSEPHGLRMVTMQKAFEKSSNVGMASLAHKAYRTKQDKIRFIDKLAEFGLTAKTGLEIKGERRPTIKHPERNKSSWYGTTIPWMAHGYELMLTPLQTLNLYNAVANNGRLMKPYLVSDVIEGDEVVVEKGPTVLNEQIASPDAINKARYLLEGVVKRGTGKKNVYSDYVSIAGKTGTSVVGYADGDGRKEYHASFAGYFPAERPRYSMIVMVYEPEGAYYGGAVAGPAFKNIAERIMSVKREMMLVVNEGEAADGKKLPEKHQGFADDYKDLLSYVELPYEKKTKSRWVEVNPSAKNRVKIDRLKLKNKIVPDVKGMGLRDALYILENLGLEVEFKGFGKVSSQSLRPGIKIEKESKIVLQLK